MRSLAEMVMQNRWLASLVIALTMLFSLVIPGLFWLGSMVASLVLLREGEHSALQISFAGLFVALVIGWYFGRPMLLLTLLCSLLMAQTLRITVSWVRTLLVNILFSFVCIVWFSIKPTVEMQMVLQLVMKQMQAELIPLLQQNYGIAQEDMIFITEFLTTLVIPLTFVLFMQVFSLVSVVVARCLQALLYNPGGFKQEFYQLRMPLKVTIGLCLAMFVLPSVNYMLVVLFFVCSVPLAFTGLAVIHGLSAKIKLAPFCLWGFYVLFILVFYVVYPLLVILAIVDSAFNLRKLPTVTSA